MNRFGGYIVLGILLLVFGGILFWSISQPDPVVEQSFPMEQQISTGDSLGWSGYKITSVVVLDNAGEADQLWYVGNGAVNRSGLGYATSTGGNWDVQTLDNPIMDRGDDWEYGGLRGMDIEKDGVYKMWYTAENLDDGVARLGYATSTNGESWTRSAQNPILDAEGWYAAGIDSPTVLKVGTTYHMWFSGRASEDGPYAIGHATSTNGINWTVDPAPVFTGQAEWDAYSVFDPHVEYRNGLYEMWFSGMPDDNSLSAIGRAYSDNATAWAEDVDNNPLIGNRDAGIVEPFFQYFNDKYRVWLTVASDPGKEEELYYTTWPQEIAEGINPL